MRHAPIAATLLALATVAIPSAATADSPTLRIQVTDHEGEGGVDLTFGGSFVAGLVRALAPARVRCDGDHDPELGSLMAELAREGEGARAMARAADGDVVRAHRHDGLVELDVRGADGDDAEIVLPWAVARCLLVGGELETRDLARALEQGELRIEAHDDEDHVTITLK